MTGSIPSTSSSSTSSSSSGVLSNTVFQIQYLASQIQTNTDGTTSRIQASETFKIDAKTCLSKRECQQLLDVLQSHVMSFVREKEARATAVAGSAVEQEAVLSPDTIVQLSRKLKDFALANYMMKAQQIMIHGAKFKQKIGEDIRFVSDAFFLEMKAKELFNFGLTNCAHLTKIPGKIGELGTLEFLGLNNNALKDLPDEICGLMKLKTLNVSYNDLTALPANMGSLVSLEVLDVSGNKRLDTLPDTFKSLVHLKKIDVTGTALSNNAIELLRDLKRNNYTLDIVGIDLG